MDLAGAEITPEWLRQRSTDCAARAAISESSAEVGKTREAVIAAVLVPIIVRPSGLSVLLTQRTQHLRDHAGQISFPGGRCEPQDDTRQTTALRESQEEVGLEAAQVEVLGELPDYYTGTGFCITPVVGLVTPPLNLRLDDFEVAEVFEVPLGFFLDPANYRRDSLIYEGKEREYWAVPWREFYIWGATAGILVSLRECLLR